MTAFAALNVEPMFVNEIKFRHLISVVKTRTTIVYSIAQSIGKQSGVRHSHATRTDVSTLAAVYTYKRAEEVHAARSYTTSSHIKAT